MKLRYLFIILVILILAPLVAVWVSSYAGINIPYMLEGIAVAAILFLIFFYKRVVSPMNTIADGMDLLSAQDFGSRLSKVGQAEADRIVELFNRLMTQVKNERLRLREQNHFLDLLVNVSPMGVVILDSEERVTLMNPAACKFLALEGDCTDKPLWQIKSELLAEIAKIEPEQQGVVRLNGANIFHCSRLSFLDRGYRRPFIIIEPLTDEIHKAERSAYEKVIRMIAHEVNNSVGGITATLNAVSDAISSVSKAGVESDVNDILQVIKVCEERSYNLSRFITGFANVVKIPAPVLQRVGINDCVTPCIRFMQNMCQEKGIELRTTLTGEDVSVNADVLLFEQVMVNIVKNSVESIVDGGVITISTSGLPAQIIVTDNGSGVAKGNEGVLFTPFFSTKTNGRGLGLMFIREILTAHGCSFSLKTGSDGLTRFVISFP